MKVYDKIWVMLNNKPAELTVSKIIETNYIDNTGVQRFEQKVFASFTATFEHDFVIEKEYYNTKTELMNAVFEIENE